FATNDNGTSWIGAHISSVPDLQPVQSVAWVPSGTTHLDLQAGNDFKFTVATGPSTIAFDNAGTSLAGNARRLRITITNGGLFTVTWPASVTWLAGTSPLLKNAGVDIVELFTPDLGVTWYGWPAQPTTASTPPICSVRATTLQAIVGSGFISFPTEDTDALGMHDPASDTRITLQTGQAGIWRFAVNLNMDAAFSGLGHVVVDLYKNGAALRTVDTPMQDSWSAQTLAFEAIDPNGAATDFYRVFVTVVGGATVNINAANPRWFTA